MKIAFVLPKLINQGPIIVAKDIIENIKNNVELVDIYCFDDLNEIAFNCNIFKITFFQKIDFEKYDVVHSHMFLPDFYIWYHKKDHYNNTLFISTLHQNIYENLKGNYNSFIAIIFEKIWLLFLNKQTIVVALTNTMKEFYSKKVNANFKTIYNGRNISENLKSTIDEEDLIIIRNEKIKFKLIICHCLLTKRKGIDQIIKSLIFLKEFKLFIIGNGKELENLERLARQFGVIDRCVFWGYKTNAASYLKYFDIYVISSYSEGFPLGLLEAGSSKLPVVCSDIPIFRELFTQEEVCFFQLNDAHSLSIAIEVAYNNRESFSNRIFNKINEKYNVNIMANSYLKLYKSLN